MNNLAVVGSGFAGLIDTLLLSENPESNITVYDKTPYFGGLSASREILGFNVDFGVQLFDSIQRELYESISDIMDGQMDKIDFVYQSGYKRILSDKFTLPDLSSESDSTKKDITDELISLASNPEISQTSMENSENLHELMIKRYGPTAGLIYINIFKKVFLQDPLKISASSLNRTPLHRLKHLEDEKMNVLKSNPYLNNILAARRRTIGTVDDFVSGYPSDGKAMGGFCNRIYQVLKKRGVKFKLGNAVKVKPSNGNNSVEVISNNESKSFDHLIWAGDTHDPLLNDLSIDMQMDNKRFKTPMLFGVIKLKARDIKDFTYIHNFSIEDLTYRIASHGIYSNQITSDGYSFITLECPFDLNNFEKGNEKKYINKMWEETKHYKIVGEDASIEDFKLLTVPSSYKMPLIDFNSTYQKFKNETSKYSKIISVHSLNNFLRRELFDDCKLLTSPFL